MKNVVVQSAGMRAAFMTGGGVCVILAAIGVVVPGMPTTVFVLGASYCFARSCPAWDRWLHEHRLLGAGLRRFRETGGMTARAKCLALTSMWLGIGVSLVTLRSAPVLASLAVAVAGIVGSTVILFGVRTVAAVQPSLADVSASR